MHVHLCLCVCVRTCVPTPANTRVKHKAIQLSTWPKGEGSTAEGGKERWMDGWHRRAGIQMNGSGRNEGSEMCSLGVKGEDGQGRKRAEPGDLHVQMAGRR